MPPEEAPPVTLNLRNEINFARSLLHTIVDHLDGYRFDLQYNRAETERAEKLLRLVDELKKIRTDLFDIAHWGEE